jgi:arylformamidase
LLQLATAPEERKGNALERRPFAGNQSPDASRDAEAGMTIDYEAEYNNRARVREHPEIFVRWDREAAAYREDARAHGAKLGISYGPGERQRYDFFPGKDAHPNAPLAVFIHGGWWRSFDRSAYSQMARGLNAHGVNVALPSYDLCPAVDIPGIIGQMRALCISLWDTYKKRLMVLGHSAGGHLTACMVATQWHTLSSHAPKDLVPFGYAISGVFDLKPLLAVSMNADLRLTAETARTASPLEWPLPPQRSLDAVVGAEESSEFLRQSRLIADDWAGKGAVTRYEAVPGANHYTVIDPLSDPGSAMVERVRRLAERVNAMALSA